MLLLIFIKTVHLPTRRPSGRLEAVQLMRVMDDMLEKAGANQTFEVKGLSQVCIFFYITLPSHLYECVVNSIYI